MVGVVGISSLPTGLCLIPGPLPKKRCVGAILLFLRSNAKERIKKIAKEKETTRAALLKKQAMGQEKAQYRYQLISKRYQ